MFNVMNKDILNNTPGLAGALAPNNALPGYQQTLALLAGSPALGKGDPGLAGTIDERGYTRQKGTVSIGVEDPNAKLPAAMSLNSSVNPAVAGQSITFTAAITVSPPYGSNGTPTGTVTFLDGITVLGTTFTTSGLALGATTSSPFIPATATSPTAIHRWRSRSTTESRASSGDTWLSPDDALFHGFSKRSAYYLGKKENLVGRAS